MKEQKLLQESNVEKLMCGVHRFNVENWEVSKQEKHWKYGDFGYLNMALNVADASLEIREFGDCYKLTIKENGVEEEYVCHKPGCVGKELRFPAQLSLDGLVKRIKANHENRERKRELEERHEYTDKFKKLLDKLKPT